MRLSVTVLLIFCTISSLSGCAAFPRTTSRAELSYISPTLKILQKLPAPSGKMLVGVYGFRDQTGQYKPNSNGTSFSTSVTQGAASILVQTLLRSNWFIPVEREGLNNILTERKIIRAAREKTKPGGTSATNGNGAIEPAPLMPAAIVIEGGIISYETNILTGGVGAKYFATGGSAQFRSDQVTVFLRAVNVETGAILNSVSASKTILSQEIDLSVFRYISLQRLLEAEVGLSANEPPQQCVQEAIEKAVIALIIDGVVAGHWSLKKPRDMDNAVIRDYLEERGYSFDRSFQTPLGNPS